MNNQEIEIPAPEEGNGKTFTPTFDKAYLHDALEVAKSYWCSAERIKFESECEETIFLESHKVGRTSNEIVAAYVLHLRAVFWSQMKLTEWAMAEYEKKHGDPADMDSTVFHTIADFEIERAGYVDDYQWGLLNGRLSAFDWMLGNEWGSTDKCLSKNGSTTKVEEGGSAGEQ